MSNMSYHCEVQRANRVQHIKEEIGVGNIIKEKYIRHNLNEPGRYVCITDTGVTVIKSEDKNIIITMYITTKKELLQVFSNPNKIPAFLNKKVDRNQSKFIREGKTIWE